MAQALRVLSENASDREIRDFLRAVAYRWNTLKSGTFTWDPPSVGAGATVNTALTSATIPALTGIVAGMPVRVTTPSTISAGLIAQSWVSATNELTISLTNVTAAPIDDPSGTWGFLGVTE